MTALVDMKGITKSFDGVRALHGVDFAVGENEIDGLLGDNGAGKSTLIKILSGLHRPDSGSLQFKGKGVDLRRYSIKEARRLGIETVYQERSLGDKQPLWRNIFCGRHLTNRLGFINVRAEKKATEEILRGVLGLSGIGARPDSPVKVLSGGERQGLAIGRAMHFQADLVIMDEPTTALAEKEVRQVLRFIGRIKEQGRSGILISHNLPHVFLVADRFVILERRGQIAGEFKKGDLGLEDLSALLLDLTRISTIQPLGKGEKERREDGS